jgi:molecular chaperone DnaK
MAFGIDLGTTNSCVAHIDDAGRATVIKSALGEDTTPSVVYFESARHAIVGRTARNAALIAPDLVVQHVKRDMGKNVEYTFHGKPHSPEMVSAIILRELARGVEENTGQVVRDVVITVPASFGVAEQEATRRAGQFADLNVLDLLAEPVAAALHYQAVTGAGPGQRHILVYDLGGGTFDTTVIRVDGDAIAVVCSDGDARLGGADWDAVIVEHLLAEFTAKHPALRPREDASFMQDLAIEAERLKEGLSSVESRRYVMRFGGAVCHVTVSRDELEKLTESLLTRTIAVTERTTATARARGVAGFDDVLLVGGMTKMPAVTRALKERLGLTARLHQPDLAVAKGAALRALALTIRPAAGGPARGGLAGGAATTLRSPEDVAATTGLTVSEVEELARKRVTTVVSRSFGVMTLDARDPAAMTDPLNARKMIVHLLSANAPLPEDTGPFVFHTTVANQRLAMIEVWEQTSEWESGDLADNQKIGEGLLKLPAKLSALTPLEVTFYMSETGRLTVRAAEPGSGQNLEFHLQIGDLDPAQLDQARRSVADYDVSGD